ncbi:hypothetical protein [Winogradskya humida]|uniref:Secreted protein n=1 Tax=Winogradskya humida TaxID=113566 RepID=A0ABQ3ZIF8_9ACTN|nr:hypothetical protein [Actinoplanes humidus]GIE18312.1 hypothetical protein Ahu01nite_014140 [Actinoplanes humidus]
MRHRRTVPARRRGVAATVAGASVFAILLAGHYWQSRAAEPPVTVPSLPAATPSPSASAPDGPLRVLAPAGVRVGLQPAVRLSRQASDDQTLVVLIRATGAEWYVTPCYPDPAGRTSTCPGAMFGRTARESGSWELKALLLSGRMSDQGGIRGLKVVQRSAVHSYRR